MRLLAIELHHLGDAVLCLPFVRAALRAGHTTEVLCRPSAAPVFDSVLPADRIHRWSPGWDRDAGAVGSLPNLAGFDAAVCAWPDVRVHLLMARARIPRRIGFRIRPCNFYAPTPAWRRRRLFAGRVVERLMPIVLGRALLTEPLDRNPDNRPAQLGKWRQLAGHLGLAWDESPPWLAPGVPPPDAAAWLASDRTTRLLVHPGGRLPTKRWPAGRFETLLAAARDRRPELAIAVIDPPDSAALEHLPPGTHRIATPSFEGLTGLVAAAGVVLCNDSLVSHLAAACGTRTVTIFGSGDPTWFAPSGPGHETVASSACPHRPCVDRCVQPSTLCLESVAVPEVLAALLRALDRAART